MELVYSVNRDTQYRREQIKDDDTLCCLSSKNVVAFTASVDLNSGYGEGKIEDNKSDKKAVCYVYVCDIDKPWAVYPVDGFSHKVLCMEWHSNGYELLIVTDSGFCGTYKMKDYLINDWQCTHKAEVSGEAFITVKWFDMGGKIYLNGDKKDTASISEKIIRERYTPPLTHFAGTATNGWIGVTTTGMVCVGIPKSDSDELKVQHEAILTSRTRVTIADFMQDKAGNLLLITSNGQINPAISIYKVTLNLQKDFTCSIAIKPMTNFFVKSALTDKQQFSGSSSDEVKITHLKFIDKDSGFSVIVAMGNASSSQIDLWNVTRSNLYLRPYFQQQQLNPTENCVQSYQWSPVTSVTHPSLPVSIALPNFPVRYSGPIERSNPLFQYIAIAYKDGSIKLINKQLFKAIATTNLDMGFNDLDKPEKRRKVVPCIVNMTQTFTGCGLLGFDQFGCMYLMKVVNTRDTLTQVHPNYLVSLLEYLILTGFDWWDVLISLKPGMIENVIQRLSDNFVKQTSVMQEILYHRHMAIRGALYSCSAGGQQRTADCHCKLLLHTISVHFKGQLRPKGLIAQDMGPGEKLSINCSKNHDSEIDNVMASLTPDKKEFFVDENTLQAIQPLIQWVADFILYLLTSLPMSQGYGSNFPGYSILHDIPCLGTLRELMVLIRIWGVINPRCLPHFTTTTSKLDPMMEMFKILTRVWQMAKDNKGFDFEDILIDKCCLLSSQIYVTNNEQALFGNYTSVGCCSFLLQNYPIKYTFKEVPSHCKNWQNFFNENELKSAEDENDELKQQKIDVVHQINLGVKPSAPIKSCSRCGNICLLNSVAQLPHISPVVKAWEGRWLKHCLCGGIWVKVQTSKTEHSAV